MPVEKATLSKDDINSSRYFASFVNNDLKLIAIASNDSRALVAASNDVDELD